MNKIKEVVITRILEAPRDLVYQAWIDPKHIQNWYGPQMFTVSDCEIEPTPGGDYWITMLGPNGMEYPNKGVFNELVENEKLVITMMADADETGNFQFEMLNTITFEEQDGKTKMTLRVEVTKATPKHLENLSGLEQGWNSSFGRLADYLLKVS